VHCFIFGDNSELDAYNNATCQLTKTFQHNSGLKRLCHMTMTREAFRSRLNFTYVPLKNLVTETLY